MSIALKSERPEAISSESDTALLQWMRQCPEPRGLRVYLSPTLLRHSPTLSRHFLALGCTVTVKIG